LFERSPGSENQYDRGHNFQFKKSKVVIIMVIGLRTLHGRSRILRRHWADMRF